MKTKPKLTVLFEADFADGERYYQGTDDESLIHPKDAEGNGPSAYRDIQDRMNEVVAFHLVDIETGTRYTVDLRDCHFEVDGHRFKIEDNDVPLTNVRLFFSRFTNVDSTVEMTMGEDGEWGNRKEVDRAHYVDRYRMGFTALQGAKEITRVIDIKGGS